MAHKSNGALQQSGCWALRNICNGRSENIKRALASGAADVLNAAATCAHAEAVKMAKEALDIIK